jgi:flagellar protein FlaG
MSGETIASAILLITAVVCAAVLIVAIYPAVFTMVGTFGSASHTADQNIRTDFKIVLATNTSTYATIYMKNVGTVKIPAADIQHSSIFCGEEGNIQPTTPAEIKLNNVLLSDTSYWNPGDTLSILVPLPTPSPNDVLYFQFVLPNGVSQSVTFSGRTTS